MPIYYIFSISLFLLLAPAFSFAQTDESEKDAFFIRKIYDEALENGSAFDWLTYLSEEIGGRLSGSPEANEAVEYTKTIMDTLNMDKTWLQECTVPHWVRGESEIAQIMPFGQAEKKTMQALALGNSGSTGKQGITADVIEVQELSELDELGEENIKGKIVFFNRPFNQKYIRTFHAYGAAVDQRVYGPARAAKYGAVGALVRSMTNKQDDVPHTGVTVFEEGIPLIGALAISTNDADFLSEQIKKNDVVKVYMRATPEKLPDTQSFNVIGEIKGSEFPDEIILVGGHLDSWDVGGGAHDDGAGCVHAMDVINILKNLNYKPKRTIRCVLFMNEENGLGGALEYAKVSNENKEFHMAAIESDAGGFTPRGFACESDSELFKEKYKALTQWLPLLEPYKLSFETGGGGADISPLKSQKGILIGFRPDSQRYFDYHHTKIDRIDAVNKRELELGAASITSLVYLLDKYGL